MTHLWLVGRPDDWRAQGHNEARGSRAGLAELEFGDRLVFFYGWRNRILLNQIPKNKISVNRDERKVAFQLQNIEIDI